MTTSGAKALAKIEEIDRVKREIYNEPQKLDR